MGILKSGVLGPFRNKTGAIIGRRHRSQNVITALYHKSNKPSTVKQLEAQVKFGLLNSFFSYIEPLIKPGFKQYAKGKSPVNAAFTYNYEHAFVKDGDEILINFPKIVYSRGHIAAPEGGQAIAGVENITFSWLAQPQSAYCQFTDIASFLVCNPVKEESIVLLDAANRYALEYVMRIPKDYIGNTVHCYMSFAAADGKLTGESMYIGEVIC